MKKVSVAAAAILDFVINIKGFYEEIVNFKPLEAELFTAQEEVKVASAEKKEANDKKEAAENSVKEMEKRLNEAQTTLKNVEEECAKLQWKSDLAGRLVNGLADE